MKRHYQLGVATTPEEKEEVYKFRYQIYRQQLNHTFLDHGSQLELLTDEFDDSNNSVILYAKHNGKIIGTLRVCAFKNHELPKSIIEKYSISQNMIDAVPYLGEFRFFEINKEYAKTSLALALLSFMGEQLSKKYSPEMLLFSCCQPGLLHYYFRLGCFYYTDKIFTVDFPILEIPLAYMMSDINFLKQQKAITYAFSKAMIRKNVANELEMNVMTNRRYLNELPRINLYKTKKELEPYKENIASIKSRKRLDFILSVLRQILVIHLPPNSIVITKDVVDYDIYVLLEGKLGVMHDNELMAEIKAGDIFGEMALFDDHHKRSNDIKTLTEVKIMVIPRSTMDWLERKHVENANKLLKILNQSITEKLLESNKRKKEVV